MKLRLAVIACVLMLALMPLKALAQSTSVTILPNGCGSGNFPQGSGYLTIDPTGRLCDLSNGGPTSGASQPQLSVTTGTVVTPAVPAGTTTAILAMRSGAASSINYCWDGLTTPTTGATGSCFQLNAGQTVSILGATNVTNLRLIAATGTTAVDIGYTK